MADIRLACRPRIDPQMIAGTARNIHAVDGASADQPKSLSLKNMSLIIMMTSSDSQAAAIIVRPAILF